MRRVPFAFAVAAMFAAQPVFADETRMPIDPPSEIRDAVGAPGRPAEATALDESRKPAETLAYFGLAPGMDAADLMTGQGYWAEIMGHVVGPEGSVTALEPEQFYNDEKSGEAWKALETRAPEVTLTHYPFEAFDYPAESFDFAIINLSYHDLYWESEKYRVPRTDPDGFVAHLFAAMRPGGVVGVIDHVGNPGDTRATVDALHRIDPAVVRADFERAGFVLEGQADFLANPEDDHTKLVFDPSIRGKTDRFVMKFRKPGGD